LLFVRCWNEYSSTDEHGANSASLEANNKLATVDGSPGADPWYMFDQVKAILHQWKTGTLPPTLKAATIGVDTEITRSVERQQPLQSGTRQ